MAYSVHTLKPSPGSRVTTHRVGRGNASGKGTYSTRGSKGQRARSGGRAGLKLKGMKRIIAALPKIGGFRSLRTKPTTVTLKRLQEAFADNAKVTLQALKETKLIDKNDCEAKIVGTGTLVKKFFISGVRVSASVKALVEKAGGSVSA